MVLPGDAELGEILSQLACCELFAGLPHDVIAPALAGARLESFARGAVLIRQGEVADAAYVLVGGSAEVLLERPGEPEELIAVLGAGDCIGDLAILLDQPRTATVRATRDCRAVRLGRADFFRLASTVPPFAQRLARSVARRLQHTTRERLVKRSVTDVAVIMARPGAASARMLDDLAAAIAALDGPAVNLRAIGRPQDWAQGLAEADCALILTDASAEPDLPTIRAVLDAAQAVTPRPAVDLVLCHDAGQAIAGTRSWLHDARLRACHHARAGNAHDPGRIARLIVGRATGLALSGGGARGFAHIGVLAALQERGVAIDYVAGTSMGAIMAAQHAAGFSIDEMIAATRKGYVETSGLPDYTIPWVALNSGRKTVRKLKAMFGDRTVEDLPVPYFAVASDLRTAETVVLDSGPLWQAGRISTSVPGLLPPVSRDGRLLVDGGLLDNLPVEALAQRCGGRVIASDVSVAVEFGDPEDDELCRRPQKRSTMPGIGQIMMRTAQLASVRDSRKAGTPADLYLNPQLNDVGMSDFGRLAEIVERGAAHARAKLAEWDG